MRISDWSSDVCSSDVLVATPAQVHDDDLFAHHLRRQLADVRQRVRRLQRRDDSLYARAQLEGVQRLPVGGRDVLGAADVVHPGMLRPASTEELSLGKGGVRTDNIQLSPNISK